MPAPQRRSGEYVVMPAQSSGAATSSSMASGIRSTKRSLNDDLLRVAAHRPLAVVALGVVGADRGLGAELLHAVLAGLALTAGVDEAAHADPVAHGVAGDLVAHGHDGSGDLVADGEREVGGTPLLAHGVDVGVADSGATRWRLRMSSGRRSRRSMVPWRKPEVAESAMSAGVVVGIRSLYAAPRARPVRIPRPRAMTGAVTRRSQSVARIEAATSR